MNKVLKGIGISLAAIAGAALITEAVIITVAVKELSSVNFNCNLVED